MSFKIGDPNQAFLLPPSLAEAIPESDLSRFIMEVVKQLDLTTLINKYSDLGQSAYHPRMLLRVLFYSYSQGVFSSRKIAERLRFDLRFMFLAGNQRPDFRTIADFRKENLEHLQRYFVEIVRLCLLLGLVDIGNISLDGSKIKADASEDRMVNREALSAQLAQVEAEIARLLHQAQSVDESEKEDADSESPVSQQLKDLQQLHDKLKEAKAILETDPGQKELNLTDPDSRKQNRTGPGYNAQIAVEASRQLIVSADVVSDPNDAGQLLPMIAKLEADTESQGQAKQVNADSGYATAASIEGLSEYPHIDGFTPPQDQYKQKGMPEPPFDKYSFRFDPETLECVCPEGHPMKLNSERFRAGVKIYGYRGSGCLNCDKKELCTTSKYRQLTMTSADPQVKAMREKMNTEAGKKALVTRMTTVEPVFGNLKEHLGFRSFHLRGLLKVKGEFALICTAFDLKKMHKYLKHLNFAELLGDLAPKPLSALLFSFLDHFRGFFGRIRWAR